MCRGSLFVFHFFVSRYLGALKFKMLYNVVHVAGWLATEVCVCVFIATLIYIYSYCRHLERRS